MLRLAFDFIITWRETRTRPNAYSSRYPLITVLTSDLTLVFLWASACITTLGSGDSTSWKKVSSKSFAF